MWIRQWDKQVFFIFLLSRKEHEHKSETKRVNKQELIRHFNL